MLYLDNQAQHQQQQFSSRRIPFEVTENQRTPEWVEERQKIVTASKIASIIPFTVQFCRYYFQTYADFFRGKPRPPFDATKSCNMYDKENKTVYSNTAPFKDNRAMKHGRLFEPVATQIFREYFLEEDELLELVGLWNAGGTLNWFGCSADGITLNKNTEEVISVLEVKVRYSLKIVEGVPPPLQTWMQLQGGMLTFNVPKGDYFEVSFREFEDFEEFVLDDDGSLRGLFFHNHEQDRSLHPPSLRDLDTQLAWAKKWAHRLPVRSWTIVLWELTAYNRMKVNFNADFWNAAKGKLKDYYDRNIAPEIEYRRQQEEQLMMEEWEELDLQKNRQSKEYDQILPGAENRAIVTKSDVPKNINPDIKNRKYNCHDTSASSQYEWQLRKEHEEEGVVEEPLDGSYAKVIGPIYTQDF